MKKHFKGFTLVECLIALAILGIASLVMAQIYANVSRINMSNHQVNTSLSYQMKLAEDATGTDSVSIYYGDTANVPDSHSDSQGGDCKIPSQSGTLTQSNYIKISKIEVDGSGNESTTDYYEFPVDIYVLLSRDQSDQPSKVNNAGTWVDNPNYKGSEEKEISLRYKYIVGHSNS